MDNNDSNTKEQRPRILEVLYNSFITENTKKRLRKIPPILVKWFVGFFSGFFLGFLFCYFYKTIFEGTQYDWKIVTGLFAALGAIFATILTYTEKFMKLALEKARYHIIDMEYKSKNLDKATISNKLAKELAPLINQKLFHSDTIFETRSLHYAAEKKCIAREYIKLLEKRAKASLTDNKLTEDKNINEIIVILDSGTTIAQIIDQLGKESYETGKTHWTRDESIKIFTNSIRGVLRLFKYRDQTSRYSEIPFECNIFPGKILSPYEAIADGATVKAILDLKKDGRYIIFVTTGNYLIFNTKDRAYIPIARAGFHPDVKAAGFHIADEVHVVAPLGKILINSPEAYKEEDLLGTLKRFNEKLHYSDKALDPSEQRYIIIEPKILLKAKHKYIPQTQRAEIEKDSVPYWQKKSVLITTSRESVEGKKYWLSRHFERIRTELNSLYHPENTKLPNVTEIPYIQYYRFDGLPPAPREQVEVEIPHGNLRDKDILHEFFDVPKKG